MNRFKLEAMVEEFPFLTKLGACDTENYADLEIKVKRWTPELMAIVPEHSGHRSSAGDSTDADLFFAVLQNEEVAELETAGYWSYGSQHEPDRQDSAGSLLEQVADYAGALAFLVRVQYAMCDWRESDPSTYITVYKPAKDVTVASLFEKAREKARREVEIETAF